MVGWSVGLLCSSLLLGLFIMNIKKVFRKKPETFLAVLYPVADILIGFFPKRFFGSDNILNKKMTVLYGEKDFAELIHKKKRDTAASFYVISLIFSLLFTINTTQQVLSETTFSEIQRSEAGEGDQVIDAEIVMQQEGTAYQKPVKLNIKEKKLSKEAVNIKFEETKQRISENIAGENTDLQHVYKSLNLYTYDPISQVKIQWYSNDLDLVDTTGKVNGLNMHQPVEVALKAELTLDENNQSYEVKLRVVPFFQYASIEEKMHVRIEELLSNIASGAEGSIVVLPSQIEDIQIQWLKPKQNINGVIVVSLISLLFFLITTQYKGLDKEIKKKKEDIERDFPEFINKLVLLLNAGLIVESALEIITEDYKRYGKHKPLYEELSMVIRNVQESHASLSEELRCFAQRCGVKEMMRFVSIVRENIHLGSSLVQKLELEAAQSWENRKHKAEILGRLAETKLTFPLVILLLVLIIIIMTPAFMEM